MGNLYNLNNLMVLNVGSDDWDCLHLGQNAPVFNGHEGGGTARNISGPAKGI